MVDDARYLHDLGFKGTAFDISPTAIEWGKGLHADTDIKFEITDLFQPFRVWLGAFDFVLEVYTIQPLPLEVRPQVFDSIAAFVADNGRLVLVTRGREADEEPTERPRAPSRKDLSRFAETALTLIDCLGMMGDEEETVRWFLAGYFRDQRANGQDVECIG